MAQGCKDWVSAQLSICDGKTSTTAPTIRPPIRARKGGRTPSAQQFLPGSQGPELEWLQERSGKIRNSFVMVG